MNVSEMLTRIFRNVFDDETINLYDEMTAVDVEDWDSLSHMELIECIEREFGVNFTTTEAMNTANVGDFIKLIKKKTADN